MRTKTTMTEFPIKCLSCGATGSVSRVTASLQCRCGSTDLDLWEGTSKTAAYPDPEVVARVLREHNLAGSGDPRLDEPVAHGILGLEPYRPHSADYNRLYNHGRKVKYDKENPNNPMNWGVSTAASGGTGWTQDRPDPRANWNEYAGPTPGYNPKMKDKLDAGDSHVCPVCHGTGTDPRASGGGYDEVLCRNCDGTGRVAYETESEKPTLDAHTPSGPPLGAGNHGHYSSARIMPPSSSVTTGNTAVYTYTPTAYTNIPIPVQGGTKVVAKSKADKIMMMASTLIENNSGLSTQQAFELARRAVEKYPED